ncbi:Exosome complex component RRP45, partial [Frankliniella fusca]
MKETPYSNIERNFLKTALSERKRLDGRTFDERRGVVLNFGKEYGCCHVALGDTRVLAQVSSEIQQPKSTRPNEGQVFVNVEFSPMSAEHVEPGKPSEACVEVTRVLEKCIRESKCVDVESLCIIAEEKVWALRVDLTVLNMEGNIVECASIAALAALAHFRRPDVTSTGDRLVIHDASEKEPIQTALHHFPICLTYAIFNKGKQIVADPTLIEEQTAEASLSVGMNAYRELCGLHLGGQALSDHQSILKIVQKAGASAAEIVQLIKKALAEDEEARIKNEVVGLSACIRAGRITTLCDQRMKIKINSQSIQEVAENLIARRQQNKHTKFDEDGNAIEFTPSDKIIVSIGENSAELQNVTDEIDEGMDEDAEDEMSDDNDKGRFDEEENRNDDDPVIIDVPSSSKKKAKNRERSPKKKTEITLDESDDGLEVVAELTKEEKERMKKVETLVLDDSEEEETSTLTAGEMETPSNKAKNTPDSNKKKKRNKNKNKKKGDSNKGDGSGARQWYSKNA